MKGLVLELCFCGEGGPGSGGGAGGTRSRLVTGVVVVPVALFGGSVGGTGGRSLVSGGVALGGRGVEYGWKLSGNWKCLKCWKDIFDKVLVI